MSTLEELIVIYPQQLLLELSSKDIDKAWSTKHQFSNNISQWNAYLNRLCLQVIIRWLETELDLKFVVNSDKNLASIWEVVNGTPITLNQENNQTKLVIIPSETIDTDEFRVPQEWVDISEWVADYYLAVQVNPDDSWLRIWGYATHQQLKNQGIYDESDRSYYIDGEDVIESLNVMWVAQELCPHETVKVEPLPILSATQIEILLAQLSREIEDFPHLDIPFSQWGALLANEDLRQQLYQRRLAGEIVETPIILSKWFDDLVEIGWQTIDEFIAQRTGKLNWAFSRWKKTTDDWQSINNSINLIYRSNDEEQRKIEAYKLGEKAPNDPKVINALVYLLENTKNLETRWAAVDSLWMIDKNHPLAGKRQIESLEISGTNHLVALMVAILPKGENKFSLLVRVYPDSSRYLPANFKLIILDDKDNTFLEVKSNEGDKYIQHKFSVRQGEKFGVRLGFEENLITKSFLI
ncbi:MAG: DUF1822 family protein [Cyanobacteriota bacterium]|nr:DUF1822 family protein [Cyanobacteriota bacterium]